MSEEQLIPTPSVFGENGNFLLERELGRGGMGGVYMGRDKMLDRPVAVKVMLKEYGSDAEFVEKFKKEAQAAARLIHPNIAQIYSYGIANGMPYIAMELVAGGSLDGLMRTHGNNIEIPRVMKICEQVAQALRCAADQGLVHGDVKPENVLLDANGNAKLVDFGLAAMQKDTTEIWGTPYYIAPEKVKRQGVDYRADMYSLGGTIYHALTGVAPFEGDDATEVVRARFQGPPKKPSEVRPGISPQIDFLVMKMLAVEPADRYPSFEALLEDFKKVMTTGLGLTTKLSDTAAMPTDVAASATEGAEAAKPTATGGKKLVMKGKRRLTTLRKPTASGDGEATSPSLQDSAPAVKPLVEPDGSEDEDKPDNLGLKILMFVGGIIGALVVIALILWGVSASKASSKAKANAAGIVQVVAQVKSSYEKTRAAAVALTEDIAGKAAAAEAACVGPTAELRKLLAEKYTENVLSQLKPAPTAELLAAIASTNTVAAPVAPAPADTNAAPAATAPAAAAPAVARFRAPKDDEADPNSPEGQKYLEEKAKWEAEQKAKAAAPAPAAEAPAAEASAPTTADGKIDEAPPVVKKMNDMWERAYAARAAEIRLHKGLSELIAKIDAATESPELANPTDAVLDKLGDQANTFKETFESLRSSKDIETLAKARSFITNTAEKSLEQTKRRLREEAAQAKRKADKEAAAAAEKAAKEAAAAEHAKKVEEETAAAKTKFEAIVTAGNIRQLDWKGAKRQLEALKNDLTTAEGQIAVDKEIKKVDCMELMQTVFINNMKDYTFMRRAPAGKKISLQGGTVTAVDHDAITILRKGTKKPVKMPWQTFLKDYHNNLDELITKYIVRPGAIGADGKNKITAKDRYNATTGVALILRIVCSDDPSSTGYAEKLLKEAAKKFPALLGQTKEFFPDIDFSDVEAAAASEQL